MRRLKIWMDTHISACDLICSLFLCVVAVAAILAGVNEVLAVILCFALYFLLSYLVRKFAFSEFVSTVKQLQDHADPTPMLEFYEYAMKYKLSTAQLAYMKVNRAYAIKHAKGDRAAYEAFHSMSEQELESLDLPTKMRYCAYLAEVCFELGLYDEERECYAQINELYSRIPPKYQPKFKAFVDRNDGDQRFYEAGEYEKALAFLDSTDTKKHLLMTVMNKLLRAKYLLKLERYGEARQELDFVIKNGNKLHAVTEAKALLEELEDK